MWARYLDDQTLEKLSRWLPSQRPGVLEMTRFAASGLVDTVLFLLTVLERQSIRYVFHYGSLLGVERLGGLLPWDDDSDIYLLDETTESVAAKIKPILEEHGIAMVYDPRDFFWVKQWPWLADSGHIGLSILLPSPERDDELEQGDHEQRMTLAELFPLRRYTLYGSPVWGPHDCESVLRRIYGESGSRQVLGAFRAAPLLKETEEFWRRARSSQENLDWPAISARLKSRKRSPWISWLGMPWWWLNGAYLILVRAVSARARAELARRHR